MQLAIDLLYKLISAFSYKLNLRQVLFVFPHFNFISVGLGSINFYTVYQGNKFVT